MDPAWPHLQGIYEFFLQLVINESVEVKQLKFYVTAKFVQEFLDLFDSEESVERDYLKNVLHKLYAKVSSSRVFVNASRAITTYFFSFLVQLVPRRKMIRKAINECFYTLIHEAHKFNGTAELLDI